MGRRWDGIASNPDARDAINGRMATIAAADLAPFTGALTPVLTQRQEREKARREWRWQKPPPAKLAAQPAGHTIGRTGPRMAVSVSPEV